MAAPISKDLRRRAVDAYRNGRGTYREVAEIFGVGEASVDRWLRLDRERDDVGPEPHGGVSPRIPEEQYGALAKLVAEKPDRAVVDLRDEWQRRYGVALSRSAMQRALLKAGFSWKKTLSSVRARPPQSPSATRRVPSRVEPNSA
jgi:transposase